MGVNLAVLLVSHEGAATSEADEAVRLLFPRTRFQRVGQGHLVAHGFPDRGDVCVGRHDRGLLVTTRDAALFDPSKLNQRYLKLGTSTTLLTQQSALDMFAFGRWTSGRLVRSISLNPVAGVRTSGGEPEPWEVPYWAGEHPAPADYPLRFHPLEMAESAAREVLGTYLESAPRPGLVDPEQILLDRFTRQPRTRSS